MFSELVQIFDMACGYTLFEYFMDILTEVQGITIFGSIAFIVINIPSLIFKSALSKCFSF